MTEEQILAMAREAGIRAAVMTSAYYVGVLKDSERRDLAAIGRFAHFVAAHTKQCDGCGKTSVDGWALYCVKCAESVKVKVDMEPTAYMVKPGDVTCFEYVKREESIPMFTAAQLEAAVAQERERAAKLCEDEAWRLKKIAVDNKSSATISKASGAFACAAAIRSGR
jgi:hypothetical protein